jgi:hypothetical protein
MMFLENYGSWMMIGPIERLHIRFTVGTGRTTGGGKTGVSHFSALKKASQQMNIQKISENVIVRWVVVMESILTCTSR